MEGAAAAGPAEAPVPPIPALHLPPRPAVIAREVSDGDDFGMLTRGGTAGAAAGAGGAGGGGGGGGGGGEGAAGDGAVGDASGAGEEDDDGDVLLELKREQL
jgi:hypothetical protein